MDLALSKDQAASIGRLLLTVRDLLAAAAPDIVEGHIVSPRAELVRISGRPVQTRFYAPTLHLRGTHLFVPRSSCSLCTAVILPVLPAGALAAPVVPRRVQGCAV